jgi:hypothetical protein
MLEKDADFCPYCRGSKGSDEVIEGASDAECLRIPDVEGSVQRSKTQEQRFPFP